MRRIISSILQRGSYDSIEQLPEDNPLLKSGFIEQDYRFMSMKNHYVLTAKGQREVGEFFRPKSKIEVFDLKMSGKIIETHSTDFNASDYSIIRNAIISQKLEQGSKELATLRKCSRAKIVKVTEVDYLVIRKK